MKKLKSTFVQSEDKSKEKKMEKNNEVLTDVQIAKYITNSREPLVVETKTTTTTTTTTVTKRICLPKDANVDPAEIQSLLNGDSPATVNLSCIIPPNADVTTNKNTIINDKNAVKVIDAPKSPVTHEPNQSLLSSTKIENLTESPKLNHFDNLCIENDSPCRSIFLSPEFSKIPLQKKDKNAREKINSNTFPKSKTKVKSTKKMAKEKSTTAPTEKRITRATTDSNKSTIVKTAGKGNYIDSLIDQYIGLDQKVVHPKKTPKPVQVQPKIQKAPERPKTPAMELKDLSAIFENSAEGEASPLGEKQSTVSPTEFDESSNYDYSMGTVDPSPTEMHMFNAPESPAKRPLRETNERNNTKRTLASLGDKKEKITAKKPRKNVKSIEASIMKLITNESTMSNHSNGTNSPIKIYSPSNRGKLRSKTDRLTLTKKMVEKKLHNHLNSSKCILERFGRSKELTVDAKSRLVVYNPNGNDNAHPDKTVTDSDVDILSVLAGQKRPYLVKEIDINIEH